MRSTIGGGSWGFLRAFLADPNLVGSVAPSSRFLARALIEPFKARAEPARVLEVGAGTGPVTVHLGHELGAGDELDVCEIKPELVRHLERHVLTQPQFAEAREEGRVNLFQCAVQDMDRDRQYDFVVAGLPFTTLPPAAIESVLEFIRTVLKPGGVFSYFEYVGLRRLRMLGTFGETRRRMREVSAIMDTHIRRHQIGRRTVLFNFPPAHARYWRFESPVGFA